MTTTLDTTTAPATLDAARAAIVERKAAEAKVAEAKQTEGALLASLVTLAFGEEPTDAEKATITAKNARPIPGTGSAIYFRDYGRKVNYQKVALGFLGWLMDADRRQTSTIKENFERIVEESRGDHSFRPQIKG